MKKIFFLFFTALFSASLCFAIGCKGDQNYVGIDTTNKKMTNVLEYELNENGESYSVVGSLNYLSEELVIPNTYKGLPVTRIGGYAFTEQVFLKKLVVGDNVIEIGERAFEECDLLSDLSLGKSLRKIGKYAFRDCCSLVTVTVEENVADINDGAFLGCLKLIEVFNKSSLNITKGSNLFGNVASYALNVYTPNSGRSKLTTTDEGLIIFSSENVDYLMGYVGNDYKLTVPDTIDVIYDYALYDCTNIAVLIIPAAVKRVGYSAIDVQSLVEIYNMSSVYLTEDQGLGDAYVYTDDYKSQVTKDANGYVIFNDKEEGEIYLVTYIGTSQKITIPSKVTAIRAGAFMANQNITQVNIPKNVIVIEEGAFAMCTALRKVNFDYGLWSIGDFSFMLCTSLGDVQLPDSVGVIGEGAFTGCVSLLRITLGREVSAIGEDAFLGCYRLVEICNDSSLKIRAGRPTNGGVALNARYVYSSSDGQSKLTQDKNGYVLFVNGDYKRLMGYNGNKTELTLPEVNHINAFAFVGCIGITKVNIPKTVSGIGVMAFSGCISLTEITLGETTGWRAGETMLDSNDLKNCATLVKYLTVDYILQIWTTEEGNPDEYVDENVGELEFVLNADNTGYTVYRGTYCGYNLVIPDTYEGKPVTEIADLFLFGYEDLFSVVIPETVTKIGVQAFKGCTSLLSVIIPQSVTYVGYNAFANCTSLESVIIDTDCITNYNSIFYNCTNLKGTEYYNAYYMGVKDNPYAVLIKTVSTDVNYCYIHKDTVIIMDAAFKDCNRLYQVYYQGTLATWCDQFKGHSYLMTKEREYYINGVKLSGTVTVPDGVKSIPAYAFAYCKEITQIVLPDSLESVGENAFLNDTNLTYPTTSGNLQYMASPNNPYMLLMKATSRSSYTINQNAKFIYEGVFKNNTQIKDVTFSGLTRIGKETFYGCTNLEKVTFSATLKSVDANAFTNCGKLKDVYFNGGIADWLEISFETFDSNPLSRGGNLYFNNELVTQIIIPQGVTIIPRVQFCCCKSITSVILPIGLEIIGAEAFENCVGIREIDIPSSVIEIGASAFKNCSALQEAVFHVVDGWKHNKKVLSAEDLSDVSIAARYLRYSYVSERWVRT